MHVLYIGMNDWTVTHTWKSLTPLTPGSLLIQKFTLFLFVHSIAEQLPKLEKWLLMFTWNLGHMVARGYIHIAFRSERENSSHEHILENSYTVCISYDFVITFHFCCHTYLPLSQLLSIHSHTLTLHMVNVHKKDNHNNSYTCMYWNAEEPTIIA